MNRFFRHFADQIEQLTDGVHRFTECRVLVIGDVMLDVFIWGEVQRISPEAPVPVVEVRRESHLLGGAANVVHNIASLGGRPIVVGAVGKDSAGNEILGHLRRLGLSTEGLIFTSDRPTIQKTRVIAHHQQVVRFDKEDPRPLPRESRRQILDAARSHMHQVDVVVVSDYGKGLVCGELMDAIRESARRSNIPVLVDPKVKNKHLYQEATLITPNNAEAAAMAEVSIVDEESLFHAGRILLEEMRCDKVLITRGPEGMTLFEADREPFHIPTLARKVFDVTGAGDTVIATMALSLAAGLPAREAAVLANSAAGIVVGEVGTATVTSEQLISALNRRKVENL